MSMYVQLSKAHKSLNKTMSMFSRQQDTRTQEHTVALCVTDVQAYNTSLQSLQSTWALLWLLRESPLDLVPQVSSIKSEE